MKRHPLGVWIILAVVALLACAGLALMTLISLQNYGDLTLPTCQATLSKAQVAALQDKLFSLPAIQSLIQESSGIEFHLTDCARADRFKGYLHLTLPADYSQFEVEYRTLLVFHIAWNDTNLISLTWDDSSGEATAPLELDYSTIAGKFRAGIADLESAPEIQEYLNYLKPTHANLGVIALHFTSENPDSDISYSSGSVPVYRLPSSIHWESFPEIDQAHQIIQQHLLVRDLAQCQIGMEGMFSSTSREGMYGKEAYHMHVNLQCPDYPRTAELDLHPDGHFENLKIGWEGRTDKP